MVFEAHVDGQLTGTQNFQVIAGAGAADIPSRPALAVVPPSTLYERALASTVSIENRNAQGQILHIGAGFFIAKGLVVTAFQVIDGASTLRVAKSLTALGSERPFVRIGVSQITAHYPPITQRITLSSRPIHGEVSDSKLRREESK